MMDGKTFYNLFSEKLNFDESVSDLVYETFLSEIRNKLKVGQTVEVEGIGYFKRKDSDLLIFVSEKGNEEKLYEEIKLPEKSENEFELNENVFAVGGESPVLSAEDISDSEKVSRLEEIINSLPETINSYKIIDNFDPIEYSRSKSEEDDSDESWHEEVKEELLSEDLFDDDESFEEKEIVKEEKELSEKSKDEESEIVEELNAEINEDLENEEDNLTEKKSEEKIEEPEIAEENKEKESLENDVIEQEDLDKVFGDIDDVKAEEEKESDKTKKKKKFKLFGKKKEKKEKKPKKEKKKKEKAKVKEGEKKESGENEENEEKKKLSTKLIILITVFVVVTLGGVYFFFFTGGEEHHEGEKTEAVDSTETKRTPITPEELGVKKDHTGKIEVDVHHPEKTKTEDSYNVVDPRLIKEFPHEKKLTNKIYFSDGKYMVQLSSWRDSERASQIVNKLYENGFNAFVVKAYLPQLGGTWYRVRIGFFDTLKEAKDFLKKREYLYVR